MKWIVNLFVMDIMLHVIVDTDASVSGWIQSLLTTDSKDSSDISRSRSKRSLFNFQNVIECFQPWSSVLSTYGDYGCYCGYKGHGRPLDDTDKCCFHHDKCYDAAELKASTVSQWMIGSYLTEYNFKCINNEARCTDQNNEYQKSFCECDRIAAECFLRNRKSYSNELYNINTKKYCGKDAVYSDLQTNSHILYRFYTCSLADDQDRCCVGTGYNSVYEMCCGEKVTKLPQAFSTRMRCCDQKIYDPNIRQCCYGYLHLKFSHISCCGTMGEAIDTTILKCVDGKSIPLKSDRQTGV